MTDDLPFFPKGIFYSDTETPKPGRRRRDAVEPVRTRLWIQAIRRRSGLSSGYALETLMNDGHIMANEDGIKRTSKWIRYARGDISPTGRDGFRNEIDEADARVPGTAIYYRSAFWDVLKERPLSQDEIEDSLYALTPVISSLLYEAKETDSVSRPLQKAIEQPTITAIVEQGGFHALAALILLIAQAKAIGSPQLRDLAQYGYANLLPSLRDDPIVSHELEGLMPLIDKSCKHWAFLSPNRRLDIVIFSQGILDAHDRQQNIAKQASDTD